MSQSFELRLRVFTKEGEFHCPLCHCPLNLDAVLHPVPKMAAALVPTPKPEGPHAALEQAALQFCVKWRLTSAALRSRSRVSELVAARRALCVMLREQHFSLQQIARWLGLHHTSVMNLLKAKRAPAPSAPRQAKQKNGRAA